MLKKTCLVLVSLCTSTAFGWWDQAHQLVALSAKDKLTPLSLTQTNSLLQVPITYPGSTILSGNTSTLETSASWADSIKVFSNQAAGSALSGCHYTDIPMTEDEIGTDIDESKAYSLLEQSMAHDPVNSVSCLKSAIKTLTDTSQSQTQQAIALRFVIHIVGDIGQPLHSVSLIEGSFDDRGGNGIVFSPAINIQNTDGSVSKQNKLHSIWDASLSAYLQFPYDKEKLKTGVYSETDLKTNEDLSNFLATQEQLTGPALAEAEDSNQSPEKWVVESYKVAVKNVYTDLQLNPVFSKKLKGKKSGITGITAHFKDSWEVYAAARKDLIGIQALASGYRLAYLLSAVFDRQNALPSYTSLVETIENDPNVQPLIVP